MELIFFPVRDKKEITRGKKTTALAYGKSLGKYKEGEKYHAYSYGSRDWKFNVKVTKSKEAD